MDNHHPFSEKLSFCCRFPEMESLIIGPNSLLSQLEGRIQDTMIFEFYSSLSSSIFISAGSEILKRSSCDQDLILAARETLRV